MHYVPFILNFLFLHSPHPSLCKQEDSTTELSRQQGRNHAKAGRALNPPEARGQLQGFAAISGKGESCCQHWTDTAS